MAQDDAAAAGAANTAALDAAAAADISTAAAGDAANANSAGEPFLVCPGRHCLLLLAMLARCRHLLSPYCVRARRRFVRPAPCNREAVFVSA